MRNHPIKTARWASSVLGFIIVVQMGCRTVERVNPNQEESEQVELTADDMHRFALEVIDAFKESPFLATVQQRVASGESRPALLLAKIDDRTTTGVDTRPWTDTLRAKLTAQIKVFQVVDQAADSVVVTALDATLQGVGAQVRKQSGARYTLTTNISETIGNSGRTSDYCYTISVSILNRDTMKSEWTKIKEFRKIKTK